MPPDKKKPPARDRRLPRDDVEVAGVDTSDHSLSIPVSQLLPRPVRPDEIRELRRLWWQHARLGHRLPAEAVSAAMMTEEQAQTLWLSLPSISDDGLARLGVDRASAHRAGGLAWSRIITAGRAFDFDRGGVPAIVQPVWRGPAPSIYQGVQHPVLADLIAWCPAEPARWWYRWCCDTPALGDEYIEDAHALGPLYCHRTPLDWLRSGCRGTVLLAFAEHYAPDVGRAAA